MLKTLIRSFKFLIGLSDSYDMIRGQIILMEPKPSLDKAYSLVLWEERQKETRNPAIIVESFAMNVGFKRQRKDALPQLS